MYINCTYTAVMTKRSKYKNWRKILVICSVFIIIILLPVAVYLYLSKSITSIAWYDSNWGYRKAISMENGTSATLIDEEVLVVMDTSILISNSKLNSDCSDLRFVDKDDTTLLEYWIEGECNTDNTQIWVKIPSMPIGEYTIYSYYGNSSATSGEEVWDGNFIVMSTVLCPEGWTRASEYDDRFPFGSNTYGTTGGSSWHSHNITDTITGATMYRVDIGNGDRSFSLYTHTHSIDITTSTESIVPPYLSTIFCKNNKITYFQYSIAMSTSSEIPEGWDHTSELDNKFPRGSSTYGTSGGSSSHYHTTPAGQTSVGSNSATSNSDADAGQPNFARPAHTHALGSSTSSASDNLPPYYTVNYLQAELNNSYLPDFVSMADSLPPLGWNNFDQLNEKFPMGSEVAGTTGGSATHTHTGSMTVGSASSTADGYDTSSGGRTSCRAHNHGGTYSYTTPEASNFPEYVTTVFIERKISIPTTVESEMTANTLPDAPDELLIEGQVTPTEVRDLTPEFSAIFSDPDTEDVGVYYQIQVNTKSDFTGTLMWDSEKQDISAITNGSRSSDISYAGTPLSHDGSTYYWRIRFWDSSEGVSAWSLTASFTMDNPPISPTIREPEALSINTIRWYFTDNAKNEDGFILLDENENFVKYCLGENLTYCDESGLDENTSYTRKIQAYNEIGTSVPSETATTYTLLSAPNAPILLERGSTSLKIALDEMNSADAPYILYEESTDKYVDFQTNLLVEDAVWGTYEEFGGSEGVLINDFEKGVKYSFYVKSKNGSGIETEYSGSLDAVTKLDPPSDIQTLEITDKKILWKIVDDNIYKIGYRIYDQTGTLLKTCLIDQMTNCLEENLFSNTTYQRKAKVFNNNTESDFSNVFLFTTSPGSSSISSISPVNSETLRISIVGNNRDSIEVFENLSGKHLDNTFGILSSTQKVFPYVSSIDVVGLLPNTKYEFKVRSNNSIGVVTGWSPSVSSYTFANKPGIAKIESISSNSARIFVDSLTNPSTTEYLIRENNSGLFLDYQSNSLSQSQKWATISQLGNTNGIVVNGLEVGKQYSFSARARNFNMNNTDWSDPVYVGTSAIIKNVAPSLKVTLASSEDIDVTLPQNGQYGEKIVRLKMEEYLVADIPTLFDQDRDWGDAVVLSSVDERKTVVKLSESHGVVKPYTMYVYKDATNAFLICPLAKTLEEVTLDCPEGIRFIGNFPQSVDYKEGKLSVSQAIIGGVEYWVADGITGTGGLGYIQEDKNDVGESPGKEVPDKEVSSSPRILDVLKNRIVDIASSLGIDKLEEKDLKRVSVAGNVVTATVSVTLLLGGLSQTWYGMIQLISIFLSSLGFRRKRLGYGFVYDSVTKNPVHMAMVRVFDSKGKLVETLVTDINGRFFGFLKNGKYNLTVSKSGYIFPSSIVKGLEDYPIQNIYQGNLVIGKDSGDIQLAIPIDSKEISGVSKHFSSLRNIFKRIILVFNVLIFLTGISISMYTYSIFPNIENLILLIMYIIPLVVILRSIFNNQDRYGKVVDQKGDSVEGVSVTLREMDFDKVVAVRVTDSKGRYRFILDKGKYSMSVDAEGYGDSDIKGGSLVNVNKNNYILCRKIVVKKY